MKMFSLAYGNIAFHCFVIVAAVIGGVSGVPLSRIISDSIKQIRSSPDAPPAQPMNLDLQAPNDTEEGFPSRTNEIARITEEPVLRSRRDAGDDDIQRCSVTGDSPVVLHPNDLDSLSLNTSTFLGLDPVQREHPQIPSDQPAAGSCNSAATPSWWPGTEYNLRAFCPWRWVLKDVNEEIDGDVYPRFVKEAECLCSYCIKDTSSLCQEIRQQVTVFQKIGCHNGLAVMLKKSIHVKKSCYCSGARVDSASGSDSGPDSLPQESE